ncbi:MAG: PEBP family protein [Cyanobacteria bacterium J06560_5]
MRKLTSILLTSLMLTACGKVDQQGLERNETATPDSADSAESLRTEAPPPPRPEGPPRPEEPESTNVTTSTVSNGAVTFRMDVWADNWFAAYLDETLIVEDSVSITTERSFNAESVTFNADYPLNLNFIVKDFKENDTGLEYIGENNQQMGDGGFIMQLTDTTTGAVVAVTNSLFDCFVIHEAPLDKSCENELNPVAGTAPCDFVETPEPDGWMLASYDDSEWTATTVHSSSAVDPKQGYDQISWDESAEFIWGPDLETDNTLLCRVTISSP